MSATAGRRPTLHALARRAFAAAALALGAVATSSAWSLLPVGPALAAELSVTDFPHVRYRDAQLLDPRAGPAPVGDIEAGHAKAGSCAGCHGPEGISVVPMFPHIAGQSAAYTYWQLVAYWLRAEPDQPMTPVLQPLEEKDLRDLAAYYASLDPAAAALAPPAAIDAELARAGAALYARGDPGRGIVPCQGCHGQDARGVAGLPPSYPRLRGQSHDWLLQKLARYRAGEDIHSTQDLVMQYVAAPLQDGDIAALAAHLASLPRGPDPAH